VASGRPYYDPEGNLRVDGTFASTELGQNTRTLVREGHVRTASVAMIPTKKSKDEDGTTRIVKADLLNGAFTPVPSNRSAMVLSAKSAAKVLDGVDTLLKAGARNSAGDQAIVQAIHDLASNLGAICGDGSSEEGGRPAGDPDNDGDANGVERGRPKAVETTPTPRPLRLPRRRVTPRARPPQTTPPPRPPPTPPSTSTPKSRGS
jgi:hypothetical protein